MRSRSAQIAVTWCSPSSRMRRGSPGASGAAGGGWPVKSVTTPQSRVRPGSRARRPWRGRPPQGHEGGAEDGDGDAQQEQLGQRGEEEQRHRGEDRGDAGQQRRVRAEAREVLAHRELEAGQGGERDRRSRAAGASGCRRSGPRRRSARARPGRTARRAGPAPTARAAPRPCARAGCRLPRRSRAGRGRARAGRRALGRRRRVGAPDGALAAATAHGGSGCQVANGQPEESLTCHQPISIPTSPSRGRTCQYAAAALAEVAAGDADEPVAVGLEQHPLAQEPGLLLALADRAQQRPGLARVARRARRARPRARRGPEAAARRARAAPPAPTGSGGRRAWRGRRR